MRVTFLVGARRRRDTRYVLVAPRWGTPFPGPWRVEAVVQGEPRGSHPSSASRAECSRRSSRVREAAPESTVSRANSTPARSPSARPAT